MEKAKVYFTKEITPESLVRIYEALGRELKGRVAVKISTGESGKSNYLRPALIGPLVQKLGGTIVECCTAYGGHRQNIRKHWKEIDERGFKEIAPVDIMDEFGEFEIPVENGCHLDTDIVGSGLKSYDSVLILSHFKGHVMGGFGGALKNISIGIASSAGKAKIHSAGKTTDTKLCWALKRAKQDEFLESMADACKGVIDFVGAENMAYINVANRLSVDCDCDGNPHEPEMGDLGIFASLDPVAVDQACYDAVKNAEDPGKAALIERMDSRHGIHTVEIACERHHLGLRDYEIISID
ncbi:MAG: DUF362 domain-containing protein [Oscillospiraceae bacterium]|nr:DUF362 domain-containing protein [Oscillospiraceae bacterium]